MKRADLNTPGISAIRDANGGLHSGPNDLPLEMARQMIAVGDDSATMQLIDGIDEDELVTCSSLKICTGTKKDTAVQSN